jgi:ABC-type transport system involved in multi-copper enzyme maturation permease subunit
VEEENMLKLMKLELRKHKVNTYITSSIIICLVLIGFFYLLAYAPRIEDDPDLLLFASYNNIVWLFGILSMSIFCVLSSVMYSRFVIEEYTGKRSILLFSYPLKRKKVFLAKLAVVAMFTIAAMTVSNLLSFTIFFTTESIWPLVNDTLSGAVLMRALKITLISAITIAGMGIVSMAIGFAKKSVPVTIVSTFVLISIFNNIMVNTLTSEIFAIIFTGFWLVAGAVTVFKLINAINRMEVY